MHWFQETLVLSGRPRGCHLITEEVIGRLPEISQLNFGWLHLFLQHTSASLSINENADPDVRIDMESALNTICPESSSFIHTCEGPDDMPAHVKSSVFGCQITIPISSGRLALGTWQGIYFCEHRNRAGTRRIVLTAMGQSIPDNH